MSKPTEPVVVFPGNNQKTTVVTGEQFPQQGLPPQHGLTQQQFPQQTQQQFPQQGMRAGIPQTGQQQYAGAPQTGLTGQRLPQGQHISAPLHAGPAGLQEEPKGKLHQAFDKVKIKTKKAAKVGKRKGQKGKLQHDIETCNRSIASIKQELGETLFPLLDVNDMDNVMVRFRDAKSRILQSTRSFASPIERECR
jgi:hypothetical protein